jgi:hypothetical protein
VSSLTEGKSQRKKDRREMKNFQVFCVVLAAACVVGVAFVSSATALTYLLAEWLESGAGLTATLLAEIPGELELSETLDDVDIAVLCSGILDGDVGPNGADDITELLNSSEEEISPTGLVNEALACEDDEDCGEALVWALDLPWKMVMKHFSRIYSLAVAKVT